MRDNELFPQPGEQLRIDRADARLAMSGIIIVAVVLALIMIAVFRGM